VLGLTSLKRDEFILKESDISARQFVHACRLGFKLPSSGEKVEFTAPLPGDLEEAVGRL